MLDPVYHLLMSLTSAVGSGALAIVLCTVAVRAALLPLSLRAHRAEHVRARLAPRLTALRERHGDDPAVLARESMALMRAEGSGPLAGLLPMLVQAPVFMVLYRLFTVATVGGAANALLGHALLGTELGVRFAADPTAPVFWLLFCLLAAIAWWTGSQVPASAPKFLRLLPFGVVVMGGYVPLAAGLYLLTSGAWTAAERGLARWHLNRNGSATGSPQRPRD